MLLLGGFSVTAGGAAPFQTRDQNPLTLIYGLPVPTSADVETNGSFTVDWSTDISNTSIGEITGDELLIVDGETYQTAVTTAFGVGNGWELSARLPFIAYTPGSLDRPIESYHDLLGLPQGNRLETPRDRLLFVYHRNGIEQIRLDTRRYGMGDMQLNAGRQIRSSGHFSYSIWAGIKLPTGDSDKLTGSGAADISLWNAARKKLNEKWQVYGTAGLLLPGEGEVLPDQQEDTVFFGSIGTQWRHWRSAPVKVQLEWHTGFYKDTNARLLGDVLQLTFGVDWEISPNLYFDFAIAEDIKEEASPDVNFHFTLRMRHN
jgi:hypothetical protein